MDEAVWHILASLYTIENSTKWDEMEYQMIIIVRI